MPASTVLPCIRCGACVPACPAQLSPQRLHEVLSASDVKSALAYRLTDCTECGACDAVCPSRIPLAQQFHAAKNALRERSTADAARVRFQARNARLAREAEERAEREAERARSASSADAVQAALARARARKRGVDASE